MIDLYLEQVALGEEARGLTIQKFHKDHIKGHKDDEFSETFLGSSLISAYLKPLTEGIASWKLQAASGKAGRRNLSSQAA